MLGLTVVQGRQLLDLTKNLWTLLDQDDFNKIVEIFSNAIDRAEQEYEESENKVCRGCHYDDGEVHAECVVCDKVESEE